MVVHLSKAYQLKWWLKLGGFSEGTYDNNGYNHCNLSFSDETLAGNSHHLKPVHAMVKHQDCTKPRSLNKWCEATDTISLYSN